MPRREFSRAVRVEIVKRATVNGVVRCEECHAAIQRFEIHHIKPDALEVEKVVALTAAQGILLCVPCHAEHTRDDVKIIAKAKRIEAAHLGVKTAPARPIRSAPFPTSERAAARRARGPRESLKPLALFRERTCDA